MSLHVNHHIQSQNGDRASQLDDLREEHRPGSERLGEILCHLNKGAYTRDESETDIRSLPPIDTKSAMRLRRRGDWVQLTPPQ